MQIDSGMRRTIQHQQDPKSFHQEFSGNVVNNNAEQLQADYTGHHQVHDLPRQFKCYLEITRQERVFKKNS